jgi:2'-deoxynucleoside 5'-phosphate N-hydrolase
MNIYFACSITGGREFESVYQELVAALLADGHEIPTSHLAQTEVMDQERVITPREVYERDISWLKNCDVLIAEVSAPSHGVGYEIGFALNLDKPVLCLHRQDRKVSKMITGNPHPILTVKEYDTTQKAIFQAKSFLDNL